MQWPRLSLSCLVLSWRDASDFLCHAGCRVYFLPSLIAAVVMNPPLRPLPLPLLSLPLLLLLLHPERLPHHCLQATNIAVSKVVACNGIPEVAESIEARNGSCTCSW